MNGRAPGPRARFLRAGFTDVTRAATLVEEASLTAVLPEDPPGEDGEPSGVSGAVRPTAPGVPGRRCSQAQARLVEDLSRVADPDMALLALVRLAESALSPGTDACAGEALRAALAEDGPARTRLLAVLGASQALGDYLVAHPDHLGSTSLQFGFDSAGAREYLTATVTRELAVREPSDGSGISPGNGDGAGCGEAPACPGADAARPASRAVVRAATDALRCAYRDRLVAIVADDVTSADPVEHIPVVGRRMADLVDASIENALTIARAAVGPRADGVALAVMAMGKTGARELNYISDVDVIHVVGPVAGAEVDEDTLLAVGAELATELARATSATCGEPPLWPLDTALRPEGKDGALVRTVASHEAYYRRWASSWEFQALLKARTCAGDQDLGRAYKEAIDPFVWKASRRENFVEDARAMRRRVERETARAGADDRRIKLGPGGLRDVEFTVQLLQLVHGRGDETLHVQATLDALEALSVGGYVGREAADELAWCYKFERLLEHRSQLHRLRRTHELPSRPEDLRRVGRGIDRTALGQPAALEERFHRVRRRVRALHEEIYYRPLLTVAASLSAEEMRLSPGAARDRLASVGYLDPDGALRHIQALTEGVSRRAAIQRQLLPVIIGWIGEGSDPDAGLLSFRRLSEEIGGSHWYLAMLRDSPLAARRLTQVLSCARWTTDRLSELPEAIAWLDDDADLAPRRDEALVDEVRAVLRRRSFTGDQAHLEVEAAEAVRAVLGVRTREYVRSALGDSLDGVGALRAARMLTPATDAALDGALRLAVALAISEREGGQALAGGPDAEGRWPAALAEHAVIAMGRLGGREITYASDADVLFVHDPLPGSDLDAAAAEGESVARWTARLLGAAHLPHPLAVDTNLRPEGRQGSMSRSLAAYAEYYGHWSAVWERQALLRARPAAGSRELGARFEALVNPLRWSDDGLSDDDLREIRRIKARVEAERMPRGVAPARHLKLGPGGLSDVEWAAQVLQLMHAGTVPGLRTTSTLEALAAAGEAGLLTDQEVEELTTAWLLAGRIRSAIVLGTGRTTGARLDVLPDSVREVRTVGRLLGLEPGRERDLEDVYRRAARHARVVVERVVFGASPGLPSGEPLPGSPPAGARGATTRRRAGGVGRPSARSGAGTLPGGAPTPPGPPAGTGEDDGQDPAGRPVRAPGARRAAVTRRSRLPRQGAVGSPFPWEG